MKFLEPSANIKLVIAGTLSVAIALGVGRFAYTPILPFMQNDLILSSTDLGALASWNFFGYLVGSMVPLLSKNIVYRQRIIFFIALGLSVLTTALMGSVDMFALLVCIRFVAGISSALTLILGTGLIFKALELTGHSYLKLAHFCGFGIGIIISAVVVAITNKLGFNWSSQWMILAFLCCLLSIPVLFYIPKEKKPETTLKQVIVLKIHSNLPFIFISIGYGLFGAGYIIFGTFISAMSKNLPYLYSFGEQAWLIVGIAATPSVFLWQKLSNFIGRDLSLSLACMVSAFGVFLAIEFVSVIWIALGCIMYGAGMPGIVALTLLEGKNRYQGLITSAVAILTLSFSIGQMIGPLLAGFLIDMIGDYFFAMQVSVLLLFLAGIFMIHPCRVFNHLTDS